MDLKKIARLSRLSFSEEEELKLNAQLSKIVMAFDRIKSVNTQDVEPLVTPVKIEGKLRQDQPQFEINTDEYMSIAPEVSGRLYKVPRVIS
ncbi:MAG: Asp-tRNA(Asn)/Glu-tRNA(Gln) amidotransferase subunit GatC [Bdellovibrionaceae bacterium]|nr:Asp-tRNA(Asn)/Glu-tRNA(Gln) amidotransferase subunit GatC [Pseudobdellovibrionaceae bacterium]